MSDHASEPSSGPPDADVKTARQRLMVAFRQEQGLATAPGHRALLGQLMRGVGMGDLGLPAIPTAAVELDVLLREDERATQDLVDLVEAHPDLAAAVAGVAGGPQSPDLPRQLARLGLDRLWELTIEQLLASALFQVDGHQAAADEVRTAMVGAGQEAHRVVASARSPLFTAALLHGVGKLVVLHAAAGSGAPVAGEVLTGLMARHHAALGMIALERWGFTPLVAQAVGFQDHPSAAPEGVQDLAAQVAACRPAAPGQAALTRSRAAPAASAPWRA